MPGQRPDLAHEWRFRIGDAFPADSPLARFVVAVAQAMNDNEFANSQFVKAQKEYERIYFFNLACSHLYEAAETFRQAHREWEEVRAFVASSDQGSQDDFVLVTGLADPSADWPANRLKELRNSFFHYLRLDRAAANAGELPIVDGLKETAKYDGWVVIEADAVLTGIRALFADDVFLNTLAADYEEDELERLVSSLPDLQAALNRFAQKTVGRYLRELPDGIVRETKGE